MATTGKRRGYETLRDMLLSLGVILAGVLVFVALQPKHDHDPVPAVDYQPQVDLVAHQAAYQVVAPQPLPPKTQVNYVRTSIDPAVELHLGLVFDAKRFAEVDETNRPLPAFFQAAHVPARPDGTVSAGGQTYEVRREPAGSGSHVALVRPLPGGGLVALSDGGTVNGATFDELVAAAGSLQPQPRS